MLVDMKNWREFFKGKKVTQMGLGLLGRGLRDADFLVRHGAEVLVTDLKSEKELTPSLKKLKKVCGYVISTSDVDITYPQAKIRFVLGKHKLEDFRNRDFILKAAGVPLNSPYIAEARRNKIPIEMDASLFFKLMPDGVTFIGITGTRGKTTTAYLIYEIIKRFLKVRPQTAKGGLTSSRPKVLLAGNIKDTATLPLLEKVRAGDFVVAELDSWQLQGFGDSKISPHISVFTTFLPDHLNYYGGDMGKYFQDKANIFKYQKNEDVFILGEQITRLNLKNEKGSTFKNLKSKKIVVRATDLPKNWKLKILGEHNRANTACALAVARALKIPDGISRKAIENFGGVQGRLEFIREINGVKIYNDTCATTPDATMAALRALNQVRFDETSNLTWKNKIILILGGSDKGLDMMELVEEIPKYCKAVVLLPGTGTDKISSKFQVPSSKQLSITKVQKLEEAIRRAIKISERGDTILFSPAFASFGQFVNEYDRGEQFNEIVKKLA